MTTLDNNTAFAAGTKMHHATRAKATKIAATLRVEYPHVEFEAITDDIEHDTFVDELTGWSVQYGGKEVGELGVKELTLEAVLALVQDAGHDPEADPETGEIEDDEPVSHSTVKEKYKVLYAEVSENGRNCGDWLATFLNGQCLLADGKIDVERFAAVLTSNGVDLGTPKWASAYRLQSGARGWRGRFRMSGRVVLEKTVAQNGVIFGAEGDQFAVPADALEALRAKHAKALARLNRGNQKAEG